MADLSKTDIKMIVTYLGDAAKLYAAHPSTKMANRARLINKLINKLNRQTKQ